MRFPWQKDKEAETKELCAEVAIFCFDKHQEIVKSLLSDKEQANLSVETYISAVSETLCCFLHLIDRALFDFAKRSRDERMDILVHASIFACTRVLVQITGVEKATAYPVAYDSFTAMYDARGSEYAGVGDDWLKKVITRYAAHLVQTLHNDDPTFELIADPNHPSYQMFLKAEELMRRGFDDLVLCTGFFQPLTRTNKFLFL